MFSSCANSIPCYNLSSRLDRVLDSVTYTINVRRSICKISGFVVFAAKERSLHGKLVKSRSDDKLSGKCNNETLTRSNAFEKKVVKKAGRKEQHLWKNKDSAGSGQKALNLIRIISDLPNEKEAVYGALNKWVVWETEFPLVAASKALSILRKRSQWKQVIQIAKWMLSKGQGTTMGTYDTLLLAFDMDQRVDEAESLWNMILHTHTRSISKKLFSRMTALYDHHDMKDKIIEVFADMEELCVSPDEDTVWRIARAFEELGQEENKKVVLEKYLSKWKYIHFNGHRVRVRRNVLDKHNGQTN